MEDVMSKLLALATLAKQQGKIANFVIIDEQSELNQTNKLNCLEKAVKDQIFQTVLDSASRSTGFLPEDLATSLIEAYKKINLS
ncbi:TPA: hypothetical protein QB448_002250 [Pasteurella multocida]|nr:hypothetical protein [Pasteurella multocida]HDR1507655.1 hypothetical protein [Pasteurella multocida]